MPDALKEVWLHGYPILLLAKHCSPFCIVSLSLKYKDGLPANSMNEHITC